MKAATAAPLTVVYDACILYPAALRDLLMRVAAAGLCRAKWTEEILDEVFGSLTATRPDLDPERLLLTRRRMCEAVRDCLIEGHQELIPSLDLPDLEDLHVLAAAIRCEAQAIVTDNVRHFPAVALEPHGLRALTADAFILELIDTSPDRVMEIVRRQAAALKRPPCSIDKLLARLARQGLRRSVARLRQLS